MSPIAMDDRDPDSAITGRLVALVNTGQFLEAERQTSLLLRTNPTAGILWKVLGICLARQGKDALQPLRKAAEFMPQDSEAQRSLGCALYDAGHWLEALMSFERALAFDPDDVIALVDSANALRELRRSEEALPLYRRAVARDPRHLEALNNLGNALLEVGQSAAAVDSYRQALKVAPQNAQILCNLGIALRRIGARAEALTVTQMALARDSRSSAAHHNLGLILAADGRRDQAVAAFRQALVVDARNVDAWNNLGNTLRELGLRREARACYVSAVDIDPTRCESHCNLGNILFEFRRVADAVVCYRRALQLNPRYAPAHLSLGIALRQQRLPDAAAASCRAALAIDPNYVDAIAFQGELEADSGRFKEAEALFGRAIQLDPHCALGFSSIATHRRMTPDDGEWLAGALRLLSGSLPLTQEISLRYSLGKYFDDLARYEDAFRHYRDANELTKRYGNPYDASAVRARTDELIRRIDPAFVEALRGQSSASEVPIFIVGMPRSGTSLAEQILASHPAVFGAGEVAYWNSAYEAYTKTLGEETASRYLAQLPPVPGATLRIVDKMPANFWFVGFIHAVFPRARFIHMQRHPLDTCVSIYFQNFLNMDAYANDLPSLGDYYTQYRRVTAHWRALLPPESLLEVPYEDLIADQESWTRRMLSFVGLPWDARCLNFHETERVVITASKWQVRQKLHSSSVGRWRHYTAHLQDLRHLLDSAAGYAL